MCMNKSLINVLPFEGDIGVSVHPCSLRHCEVSCLLPLTKWESCQLFAKIWGKHWLWHPGRSLKDWLPLKWPNNYFYLSCYFRVGIWIFSKCACSYCTGTFQRHVDIEDNDKQREYYYRGIDQTSFRLAWISLLLVTTM